MIHAKDTDCTLDAAETCAVCGVFHGDPCPMCGGRGFHSETCPEVGALSSTYPPNVEPTRETMMRHAHCSACADFLTLDERLNQGERRPQEFLCTDCYHLGAAAVVGDGVCCSGCARELSL